MKIYTTIILFLALKQVDGQKVILYNYKEFANRTLVNSYNFYVPGVPCDSVIFRSNAGKIEQYKCRLTFSPDTNSNAIFRVYKKINNKIMFVDSINIPVYQSYKTEIALGSRIGGGSISKNEVIANRGLIARLYMSDDHAESTHLLSYYAIVISKDGKVQSAQNTGNRFTPEVDSIFNLLRPEDKLIFADIELKDFDGKEIEAKPIQFTIK
jgi:hypothetical protein